MTHGSKFAGLAVGLAALAALLHGAAPEGWFLAGSKPANYDTGVDQRSVFNGLPSAYLKSAKDTPDGFGTLMQQFSATQYLGKRIRYSAYVQSLGVDRWAGLWMRVDGPANGGRSPAMLAFDNMQNRPIKGATGWQRYEIVLDVPETAVNVALGILLDGNGSVWLNSNKIEVVDKSVPTTSSLRPTAEGPSNLSFQNK